MAQVITLHSHWRGKQTPIEVTVTRVTARTVSYIAVDGTFSGTVPQWQFLHSFRPGDGAQEEGALTRLKRSPGRYFFQFSGTCRLSGSPVSPFPIATLICS
jgi:hypothetical protein